MKTTLFRWLNRLGGGSTSLLLGGIGLILLVCLARMAGVLERVELQTLDLLLRWRPSEPTDERITILEFTDADIQTLGTYPVPDSIIYKLLKDLQAYEPRVIGLDIFKDIPASDPAKEDFKTAQEANQNLLGLLKDSSNIVAIEKIINSPVQAPPGMSPEKIGFADALLDRDGFVRRSLLGSVSQFDQQYHLSLTIQLASRYLAAEDFELANGIRDPNAMRFGDKELFRIKSSSGGYVNQDTANNPVLLINFRNGSTPFNRLTWSEFAAGDFAESWLQDRLILVGMTAASTKDYVNSAAIVSSNPGLVPGVELQAHAVSQIISAVLDDRPILKTWNAYWEYLGIALAGILGISFVHFRRSIPGSIAFFLGLSLLPILMGYCLILVGIWMPVFPICIVFFFNGSSTILYRIYQHEQTWKIRLEERQRVIQQSYNTIHNRPLQTLKALMRQLASEPVALSPKRLHDELQNIDDELRNIYEFMEREYLTLETRVYLTKEQAIELESPLHELLHQIYHNKLTESRQYFETIKIKLPDFCPVPSDRLSLKDKEDIARFLEEALCNVEQHAKGVTRLAVVCKQIEGRVIVQVIDNGTGWRQSESNAGALNGRGTRQARGLALRLGGTFNRWAESPKGTLCELSWPVQSPSLWQKGQQWLQIYVNRMPQRQP